MTDNKRALAMKGQIEKSLELGYSWEVIRTAGQPALASLFYGYIAIALAKLTDGFIYSDDGAWEYSYFPMQAGDFEKIYLNKECIFDDNERATIENWILLLKNNSN